MIDPTVTYEDYFNPDVSQLLTENNTPVDNFASEKQQHLLTSTLYSSNCKKGEQN